jgi:uncharacterized protein YjbJ (UPF0337 family)
MDELHALPTARAGYCRVMCGDVQSRSVAGRNLYPSRRHPATPQRKEIIMNKDQVEGKLQDIGGKIQEEAGKLVGNTEQEAKGLKNQVEGKTQEKFGDLKQKVNDATE